MRVSLLSDTIDAKLTIDDGYCWGKKKTKPRHQAVGGADSVV